MSAPVRARQGLRVLVHPRAGSGLCGLVLAVPAGSGDDPAGRSGLAHLLEHLVIAGERDGRVLPVVLNAFTTARWTAYEAACPPHRAAGTATRLLRVLEPFALDAERLRHELDVIEVEAAGDDGPATALGDRAERRAITPEDVAVFHTEHYRSEGAVLAVVGDVDPADVRAGLPELPEVPVGSAGGVPRLVDAAVSDGARALRVALPGGGPDREAVAALLLAALVGDVTAAVPETPAARAGGPAIVAGRPGWVYGRLDPVLGAAVLSLELRRSDRDEPPDPAELLAERVAGLDGAAFGGLVERAVAAVGALVADPVRAARAEAGRAILGATGPHALAAAMRATSAASVHALAERLAEAVRGA